MKFGDIAHPNQQLEHFRIFLYRGNALWRIYFIVFQACGYCHITKTPADSSWLLSTNSNPWSRPRIKRRLKKTPRKLWQVKQKKQSSKMSKNHLRKNAGFSASAKTLSCTSKKTNRLGNKFSKTDFIFSFVKLLLKTWSWLISLNVYLQGFLRRGRTRPDDSVEQKPWS